MAMKNTGPTVTFTDDQQKQLEQFGKRLLNLQTEIAIAQASNTSLKGENVRLTKEQNELLENIPVLKDKTTAAEKELAEVLSEVAGAKKELASLQEEMKTLKAAHEKRVASLNERETTLIEKEEAHEKKAASIDSVHAKLAKDQEKVEATKRTLTDALEKIEL